ncbi:MAG: hypothetical protein LBN10_05685 [Propionibacteriaceae bacterium]|nr:hypothetical protein [Propionibacteriaceae bacterium]
MVTMSPTERRLRELRRTLIEARAVPMSASCMVNRAETIAAIDTIMAGYQEDVEESIRTIEEDAQRRNWNILDQTDMVQVARERAAQIEAKARAEQEELLAEADRYVETRLAAFEAELQVTLSRVAVMRDRLISRAAKETSDEETTIMPKWTI